MPTVPPLKPQEVTTILRRLGSQKCASVDGTTVPFHSGREISPTLVRKIAQDIGVDIVDFLSQR